MSLIKISVNCMWHICSLQSFHHQNSVWLLNANFGSKMYENCKAQHVFMDKSENLRNLKIFIFFFFSKQFIKMHKCLTKWNLNMKCRKWSLAPIQFSCSCIASFTVWLDSTDLLSLVSLCSSRRRVNTDFELKDVWAYWLFLF